LEQEDFVVPVEAQYPTSQDIQLTTTATKLPYSLSMSSSSFDEASYSGSLIKKSYSEERPYVNLNATLHCFSIFDLNNNYGTPSSAFGSNTSNFINDVDELRKRSNSSE
jgi:hypothetical protein